MTNDWKAFLLTLALSLALLLGVGLYVLHIPSQPLLIVAFGLTAFLFLFSRPRTPLRETEAEAE